MALSSLNHPIESDTPSQELIDFPDNRLMIDLCGEFDRNLAKIESKLSVQLIRRGNQVAVIGAEEDRQDAVSVLQRLYQRLEMGRPVELADVDRELRMGSASENSKAIEKRRTDMSSSDRVEIKTRKKSVEPRTDAQKAYVRAMLSHELAFGIGPAGTGNCLLYTSPSPRD